MRGKVRGTKPKRARGRLKRAAPLEDRIAPEVPERYRRLVLEVMVRLPEGWDGGQQWSVALGTESQRRPNGIAFVEKLGPEGPRIVRLFPDTMEQLSDAACRWVIAHELAHVAPVLPPLADYGGTPCLYVNGEWRQSRSTLDKLRGLYEDAANRLAWDWGFRTEWEAFAAEDRAEEVSR